MQKGKHKEWRGHSYALYLRGAPGKMEPLPTYKNAPRQRRVHSYICGWNAVSDFPSLLNRTIPKEVFQATLVKCEIKANASATRDFSPKPLQR